jgi:molybdenum cofactor cytidylyltransferase
LDIRGILLCGGASTRFGADKLVEILPGADAPIAVVSARACRAAMGRVLAVVRPGARTLRELLEAQGCEVMETDRALAGLGSSLAAGVEAAADADGWIVALGDMPFVAPPTIAAVRDRIASGTLIAAPVASQRRHGHPVGFHAHLRSELLALTGDEGARSIVARHRADLVEVEVDDEGIYRDIDRREDLS